jgi:hypothetical protein
MNSKNTMFRPKMATSLQFSGFINNKHFQSKELSQLSFSMESLTLLIVGFLTKNLQPIVLFLLVSMCGSGILEETSTVLAILRLIGKKIKLIGNSHSNRWGTMMHQP